MSGQSPFPTLKYLVQSSFGIVKALRASRPAPKISYLEALSSQYGLRAEQVLTNKVDTPEPISRAAEGKSLKAITQELDEIKSFRISRAPATQRPSAIQAARKGFKGSAPEVAKSQSVPSPVANPVNLVICDAIYNSPPSFPSLRLK